MHVCDPRFGEDVGIDAELERLMGIAPKLCSTDAQLLMRDRYETMHGIYNHEVGNPHPFALVLKHWNEDNVLGGPLHERINQYVDHQILRHFGLSLDEFLDKPTYMCDLLLQMASDRNRKEKPVIDEALNALKS